MRSEDERQASKNKQNVFMSVPPSPAASEHVECVVEERRKSALET